MNIEDAMRYMSSGGGSSDMSRVLYAEVKRLREQLKKQEEDHEFYRAENALYGTKYWISGKKEKKEMTVDEAIELADSYGNSRLEAKILATEVKSLRRVHVELNEKIDRLHGEIRDWKENRKELGEEVRNVLEKFGI